MVRGPPYFLTEFTQFRKYGGRLMKYCLDCGCIMPDNHIGDFCECCLDDRGDTIPDGLRKESYNEC